MAVSESALSFIRYSRDEEAAAKVLMSIRQVPVVLLEYNGTMILI